VYCDIAGPATYHHVREPYHPHYRLSHPVRSIHVSLATLDAVHVPRRRSGDRMQDGVERVVPDNQMPTSWANCQGQVQ
jgi:hypothetical protein